MAKFVLLVTWFAMGQAPSSYTVDFTSAGSCNEAVEALKRAEAKLGSEWSRSIGPQPLKPPTVVAVCVQR